MTRVLFKHAASAVVFSAAFAILAGGGGCGLFKPKQKGAYGAECKVDTDCESLKCTEYGSMCTKPCTVDSECGEGNVCRNDENGTGDICAKPVGNPPNGGCMNESECQHGYCLKRVGQPDAPGICSKHCLSPADCPDRMKICHSISDSGLQKFCLPGDEKTPAANVPSFAPPKKKTTPTTTTTTTAAVTTAPTAPLAPVDAGAAPPAADAGAAPAADAGAAPAADAGAGRPIIKLPTLKPTGSG